MQNTTGVLVPPPERAAYSTHVPGRWGEQDQALATRKITHPLSPSKFPKGHDVTIDKDNTHSRNPSGEIKEKQHC